jgi:hypothetical protein
MPTNDLPSSGPESDKKAKEDRNLLLTRVRETEAKLGGGMKTGRQVSYETRKQIGKEIKELKAQYFAQLPRYVFGRCPVCNAPLEQVFDPWGLDGFWWQEKLSGLCPKPSACEHFRVLCGALNLNGRPPHGGGSESYPGPEVPYVIPKTLELLTMVAVISSIPMQNGYTAFPISYFSSDKPPTTALANPWTKRTCSFINPRDGKAAWTIMTDPWDFALMPWVERGKIQWIEPGDPENILKSAPANHCPYVNLTGLQLRQVIKNDKRFTQPPPHNEVVNPFSD